MATKGIKIPKSGEWPGTFQAYKDVKEFVKPNIWHFISVIGLWLIATWAIDLLLLGVFKNTVTYRVLYELAGFIISAFIQACFVLMYFYSLKEREFELKEVLTYGQQKLIKMFIVLFVMDVLLIVGFILFIIPFFIILPRLYLAPYFLVADDLNAGEAIGFSWNLTKGNAGKVYGIIGLDVLIALLFLTIIGIPFAVYFGIINSASFAYLTMYLSQPKVKIGTKAKKSPAKLQVA